VKKDKYIWTNTTGADCQLVTAVNAYHHLTGRYITAKRYMDFIELADCVFQAPAPKKLKEVWDSLGIEVGKYYLEDELDYHARKIKLPLEASIFHHEYGYHSILIIDHETKTNSFRITNFDEETNSQDWMYAENMYKYLKPTPQDDEPDWVYRTFRLKK